MSDLHSRPSVAVIGAGVAGAACAADLQRAGLRVTVFDRSAGVGGRLATRRVPWVDARGCTQEAAFDHGVQHVAPRAPRLRALMVAAEAAGQVARWRPRVHMDGPAIADGAFYVGMPGMPALAQHLLGGVVLRLGQPVQGLQRHAAGGWQLAVDGRSAGPFDQVVLAMPPRQAALLLAGHHDRWADALTALRMEPCWTLMAITDDVDWPWDAAEPPRGPLAWVARNDRKPGRGLPPGHAAWVAQASAAWSQAHLEEEPATVAEALGQALQAQLPPAGAGAPLRWYHRSVHRWRFALPAAEPGVRSCWWDAGRGLGVCGDFLGGGSVEGAWRSGTALAESMCAEAVAAQPA